MRKLIVVLMLLVARPVLASEPDSLYKALSAMPLDSLTARQYQWLMQENQLRAANAARVADSLAQERRERLRRFDEESKPGPFTKGFYVTAGILGAILLFAVLTNSP
jgi:hypothetical protein